MTTRGECNTKADVSYSDYHNQKRQSTHQQKNHHEAASASAPAPTIKPVSSTPKSTSATRKSTTITSPTPSSSSRSSTTRDGDELVQRFGGENNLHYIIMSYCDKILDDESLEQFFGDYEVDTLLRLEKEFLLAAFAGPNSKYQDLHRRVSLRHQHLFEMGLNETHFDILQEHFMNALHENWVEENIIAVCRSNFAGLRYIFMDSCTNHVTNSIDEIDFSDLRSPSDVSVLSSSNDGDDEDDDEEERELKKRLQHKETKCIICKLFKFWKHNNTSKAAAAASGGGGKMKRKLSIASTFRNHSHASSDILRRNSSAA